jgi:sortase A
MDVRVYWGDTDEVFKEGAGQYIGSFIPGYGGPILIGAHDSLYFEPLEEVQEGDIFILRTNYGEFEYQVTETKIASANDDEVFDNTTDEEQLVLYTCYPFGALIGIKDQRFYVFADKISGPVISTE